MRHTTRRHAECRHAECRHADEWREPGRQPGRQPCDLTRGLTTDAGCGPPQATRGRPPFAEPLAAALASHFSECFANALPAHLPPPLAACIATVAEGAAADGGCALCAPACGGGATGTASRPAPAERRKAPAARTAAAGAQQVHRSDERKMSHLVCMRESDTPCHSHSVSDELHAKRQRGNVQGPCHGLRLVMSCMQRGNCELSCGVTPPQLAYSILRTRRCACQQRARRHCPLALGTDAP